MKLPASGQLRIVYRDEDNTLVGSFTSGREIGETYLILGPTEKPGVWFVMRESGDVERWWQDSLEDDEILAEVE